MHLHSLFGLLTSCLSLSTVSLAAPTTERRQPKARRSDPQVEVYFDLDGTSHGDKITSLKAEGYRIISLSAYGSSVANVRYAAVWAQREGSPFEVIHDADESTYRSWYESWKARGYMSTFISATGPADSAVFAGVMEESSDVGAWEQLCGMTNPYGYQNATRGVDMLIKGFSMYGTPSDRRYCMLGHENVGNQQSTIFYTTNFTIDYPQIYESEIAKPFWRPSRLYVSDDLAITPQFVDTEVGKWVAKDSLTATELAAEVAAQKEQGLYPIDLHGGGTGEDTRFAVIFAGQDVPEERQWSATGAVTGFQDNEGTTKAFDDTMRAFMQRNGVRQAQVAIGLNGSTIAERSYTWAESNRAVVQPDDVFLLASLSKMFTAAAINNLIQAGRLNLSTPVYPFLGYHQPADPRASNITVDHLIRHSAGYDRTVSGDTAFIFRQIAQAMSNGTRAATLRDVVEFHVARQLDFAPGTSGAYSNYGYMLLEYLVTNITGTPYLDYIRDAVLGGLDVRLYETAASSHEGDRIIQESKNTGPDPTSSLSSLPPFVPAPFGGDGAIKEECMGAFSLAASAGSIARFIGRHAVMGIGGRAPYSMRDGSLEGARAFASSAFDKVDLALTINTRQFKSQAPGTYQDEFDQLRYSDLANILWDYPIA